MSDTKDSLKRGLKRGLMLVAVLVVAAMAMAGYQMLTAPADPQNAPKRSK